MYDLLPVSRSGVRLLLVSSKWFSKWCPSAKTYDVLPVSWSRSGAPAKDKRFVAGVLVSKWCPSTKMCDLLLVSWFRSGAPELSFGHYSRCLGLEVVPSTKMYDLFPVSWSRSGPSTQMHDLLPMSWSRSGAPALKCTICCLRLEVVPQHENVRCVDGVLVSKWWPKTKMSVCFRHLGLEVVPQHYGALPVSCLQQKMYDLLMVSWSRGGGPGQRCAMRCRCLGLLAVSWSRSGAPVLRCTICCRCLVSERCPSIKMYGLFAGL